VSLRRPGMEMSLEAITFWKNVERTDNPKGDLVSTIILIIL
jgi:hypothetical protein